MNFEFETDNGIKNEALFLLEQGFSIIPIQANKRPFIKWAIYQEKKPTKKEIETWWSKWPHANIGIVTGKVSSILVFDCDSDDGYNSLCRVAEFGDTVYATTGKEGGRHVYFKYPNSGGPYRNFARKLPDLDFRGDGGYVVAPPSKHLNGKCYKWINSPDVYKFAEIPEKLRVLLDDTKIVEPEPEHSNLPEWVERAMQGTSEGDRNDLCAKLAGFWFGRGFPIEEVGTIMKKWNVQNTPPLPEKELSATIDSISKRHGHQIMSALTSMNISQLEKLEYPNGEAPVYRLYTEANRFIELSADDLYSYSLFSKRLMTLINRFPAGIKQTKWIRIVNNILSEMTITVMPDECTDQGMIEGWLDRFFDIMNVGDTKLIWSSPIISEGFLYFKLDVFLRFMTGINEKLPSRKKIGRILGNLDWQYKNLRVENKEGMSQTVKVYYKKEGSK